MVDRLAVGFAVSRLAVVLGLEQAVNGHTLIQGVIASTTFTDGEKTKAA